MMCVSESSCKSYEGVQVMELSTCNLIALSNTFKCSLQAEHGKTSGANMAELLIQVS